MKFTNRLLSFSFSFIEKFSTFLRNDKCVICSQKTHLLSLCSDCDKRFLNFNNSIQRCSNCGKTLVSEQNICTDCRENPVINNIEKIIPMFSYRLWYKELLFKWKIQGYRKFAYIFSKKILKIFNEYFSDFVIVPVPSRPGKIKNQGWDQINDLMNYLKLQQNLKIMNLLIRTEKEQQKKLNREQRLAHKGTSYILNKEFSKKELPKKVVIIDDILTTGVTLENCALALKNAGVETVCAITVFIAD
jgi:ComF family protein